MPGEGGVDGCIDVGHVHDTPAILCNGLDEVVALAGRSPRVARHDAVSGRRVHLELVEEPEPVLAGGPAVNVHEQGNRTFPRGKHDPDIDLDTIGDGGEVIRLDQIEIG